MLCLWLRLSFIYPAMAVTHIRVIVRKAPGMRTIHQHPENRLFPARDSILPQEIMSRGSHVPIKLSVDSATMAFLMFITIINIIEGRRLGIICTVRM